MSAGKALAIVGGLGTLAGVGYLIVRHVTRPEGTDEPEPAEQLADVEEFAAGPDLAPLPGPAAPIPEPNGAGARVQINKSQTDSEGTVRQSAAELGGLDGYDIPLLLKGIAYQFPDDDVPF